MKENMQPGCNALWEICEVEILHRIARNGEKLKKKHRKMENKNQ